MILTRSTQTKIKIQKKIPKLLFFWTTLITCGIISFFSSELSIKALIGFFLLVETHRLFSFLLHAYPIKKNEFYQKIEILYQKYIEYFFMFDREKAKTEIMVKEQSLKQKQIQIQKQEQEQEQIKQEDQSNLYQCVLLDQFLGQKIVEYLPSTT